MAEDWNSEDESQEEYVGEESQGASSGDEDFELGNVVGSEPPAPLRPSHGHHGGHHDAPQQAASQHGPPAPPAAVAAPQPPPPAGAVPSSWPIATKGRQRQEAGTPPLVLFDLNGVLMQHRFNGTSHEHDLRPGVHHLLRLLSHYRLGVYTSSTRGTVQRALTKLAGNLHNALAQAQRAAQPGFPPRLPDQLFHVIMCREHCQPADKKLIAERGGKPWDTVKPLQRYFADLSRVLLVDDSPHKSLPAEAANMLIMPRWHGPGSSQGKSDGIIQVLVDGLLHHARSGIADVRAAAGGIARQLAALAGEPMPVLPLLAGGAGASAAAAPAAPAGARAAELASPPAAAGGEAGGGKKRKLAARGQLAGLPSSARSQLCLEAESDPQVAAALRLLYIDAVQAGGASFCCRPPDLLHFMDAMLPRVREALMLRNLPPHLIKSMSNAQLIEVAEERLSLTEERFGLSRGGQWLRVREGAAAPPPERVQQILAYSATAPVKETKKERRAKRKLEEDGEEKAAAAAAGGAGGAAGAAGAAQQGAQQGEKLPKAELNCMRRDAVLHCLALMQARGGMSALEASVFLIHRITQAVAVKPQPAEELGLASMVQRAAAACVQAGEVVELEMGKAGKPALAKGGPGGLKEVSWHALAPSAAPPSPPAAAAALATVATMLRGENAAAAGLAAAAAAAAVAAVTAGSMQQQQQQPAAVPAAAAAVGPASLMLAVFEDRGPSGAAPAALQGLPPPPQQQQQQQQHVAPAGEPAGAAQQPQQQQQQQEEAGPDKPKLSNKQRRRLRLLKLAETLGVEGPREGMSKAALKKFGTKLNRELRRRVAEGSEPFLPGFQWEEGGDSSGEDEGPAAAAAAAEQQAALHGGHFLRSCGSVEPTVPAAPAVPAAAASPAAAQGEQPPPAKRARQFFFELPAAGQVAQQVQQEPVEPAVPAAQQAQQAQQLFSSLHYEVERFARRATPSPQEVADVQQAVEGVAAAARALWPQASTVLFGSQATGLALPGSDLDIVVLNVGPNIQLAGTGFSQAQRKQLGELLEDLLDGLLGAGLIRGKAQIIEARVPIIKCCLAVGPGLMADISMGASNGAAAVDFVRRQVVAVPPLRPLCLVVKAFLRERGLNEVFTGGLSSYTVFNMVMAHLQREGFAPAPAAPPPAAPGALADTFAFLSRLASSAAGAAAGAALPGQPWGQHAALGSQQWGQQQAAQQGQLAGGQQAPPPPFDLGVLLYGFFDLFGARFAYAREAVSVRLGGVCTKIRAWRQARRPWLLAVEDPQEPGKDIASGSFGVKDVKALFSSAAELLAEVCEDAAANDEVAEPATQRAQRAQRSSSVLGGVINVEWAVGRGPEGIKARKAFEERAAAKSAFVKQQRSKTGIKGIKVGGIKLPKLVRGGGKGPGGGAATGGGYDLRPHSQSPQQGQQQAATQQPKGIKRGSKRQRLVEAQWTKKDGQFRDEDNEVDWSLRKQKKGIKRKGARGAKAAAGGGGQTPAACGGGSGRPPKRKKSGSGGGGSGKKGRGGWVTDNGAGAPGTGRKRQRRHQD